MSNDSISGGVMLAKEWSSTIDPTNWWVSEKLDGVRAYWNGTGLFTRSGREIKTPEWFTKHFPKNIHLDGELFTHRGDLGGVTGIVARAMPREIDWVCVTFQVFDSPNPNVCDEAFEARMLRALEAISDAQDGWQGDEDLPCFTPDDLPMYPVAMKRCASREHLETLLDETISMGGEGLMLRQSGSQYWRERSGDLLKVIRWKRAEAEVVGYKKDKNALRCLLVSNPEIAFDCGSGLKALDASEQVKVGETITFQFKSFNPSGKPRNPSFVCVRNYD